jgi:hypothetical protein
VTTHGCQYETGYRCWPPLLRHFVPTLHKFRYTFRKEGHRLLGEPLFHCLTNRLIGIEPPALQSLLQWPKHVIVTRRWSRTPQPKRRSVSRVAWAACARALSWSIKTLRASFPVIQGQLLALLRMRLCFTWTTLVVTYSTRNFSGSISYGLDVAGGWKSVKLGRLLRALGNFLNNVQFYFENKIK